MASVSVFSISSSQLLDRTQSSPGSRQVTPTSRTNVRKPAIVFQCSYCQELCSAKSDLASHKWDEHKDQITHITGSSIASSLTAGDENFLDPDNQHLSGFSNLEDGSESTSPPSAMRLSKRGKRQGRNKGALPIGKKTKVKGPDGIDRAEFQRGERFRGG